MDDDGSWIAEQGGRAARARLLRYAECPGAQVRRGAGWTAVATGVHSNDMNGVVSAADATLSWGLIVDLVHWFGDRRLPASWFAADASPPLRGWLLEVGATAERTGWWMGRRIDDPGTAALVHLHGARVRTDADLDDWLDIAAACGWVEDEDDRRARRQVYRQIGLDDPALRHWIARRDGMPVAMASSFVDGGVVDLCNLAVAAAWRRQGIGRVLAMTRLTDAAHAGAQLAVSAVSHDGARLYETLSFRTVPVVADACFYLPFDPARTAPARDPGS